VTIAGTLVVPSGVVIRATGDVTISGNLIVATGSEDSGAGAAEPGVAKAPAGEPQAGRGLSALQSAHLVRPGSKGGGAGAKAAGGGIVHLLSSSAPAVTGTIDVNGGAAGGTSAPTGASQTVVAGGGGGGGGGSGGDGGSGSVSAPGLPAAGTPGHYLQTVTPNPENLVL